MPISIAHRGEPRGHRENTEPAIRAAVAAGADMVEIDLRVTADGEVVLLHDETLERLWNDLRRVDSSTLEQLSRHRRPGVAVPLPSLDEAIELMLELDTRYLLDFTTAEVGVATADVAKRHGVVDRVWYAGNTEGLAAIRERQPDATIALTWTAPELPTPAIFDRVRPQYYNPQWELLDGSTVQAMHAAGLGICTWTADTSEAMKSLLDIGVDAIITNEIAQLVGLSGNR